MESSKTNIEIGQGILGLEFGMTRKDLKKKIGRPNEIETHRPDPNNEQELQEGATEVWHYDDLELSATFDEAEEWTLTSLTVSSPEYLFEGINLIGLSVEEAMQQMEFLDVGEFILMDLLPDENVPEEDEDKEFQVASIFHAGLNLWFENGITTEIQWGPIWEEEETPKKKKPKKEKAPPPKNEDDDFYPTPHLIWGDQYAVRGERYTVNGTRYMVHGERFTVNGCIPQECIAWQKNIVPHNPAIRQDCIPVLGRYGMQNADIFLPFVQLLGGFFINKTTLGTVNL